VVIFALTWGEFQLIPVLTLVLAGAAIGFLPHNFSPARIFLGDTGSLVLGFMLAGLSIMGVTKQATFTTLIIPVIIFGLPITDTFYAIWRRFRNGQPIFKADKGHIHHRLLDVGLSTRQTVMILYFCSIYFGAAAIAFDRFAGFSRYFVPIIFALFLLGLKRLEGLSSLLSAANSAPYLNRGKEREKGM
jgi:UDP-GlcNAc:undecaprenyl-phosphate GlcNAc-1-phosphate transferase